MVADWAKGSGWWDYLASYIHSTPVLLPRNRLRSYVPFSARLAEKLLIDENNKRNIKEVGNNGLAVGHVQIPRFFLCEN